MSIGLACLFGLTMPAAGEPNTAETCPLCSVAAAGARALIEQTYPDGILAEVTSQGGAVFDHVGLDAGPTSPMSFRFEAECGDGFEENHLGESMDPGNLTEVDLLFFPPIDHSYPYAELAPGSSDFGLELEFSQNLLTEDYPFWTWQVQGILAEQAVDACNARLASAGGDKDAYSLAEFNTAAGMTTVELTASLHAQCVHNRTSVNPEAPVYSEEVGAAPLFDYVDSFDTETPDLAIEAKVRCVSPHSPGVLKFVPRPVDRQPSDDLAQEVFVEQALLFATPVAPPDGSKCGLSVNGLIQTNVGADVTFHLVRHDGTPSAQHTVSTQNQDNAALFSDYFDFSKSGEGVWVGQDGMWALPGGAAAAELGSQVGPHQGSWKIVCDSHQCESQPVAYNFTCAPREQIGLTGFPPPPGTIPLPPPDPPSALAPTPTPHSPPGSIHLPVGSRPATPSATPTPHQPAGSIHLPVGSQTVHVPVGSTTGPLPPPPGSTHLPPGSTPAPPSQAHTPSESGPAHVPTGSQPVHSPLGSRPQVAPQQQQVVVTCTGGTVQGGQCSCPPRWTRQTVRIAPTAQIYNCVPPR